MIIYEICKGKLLLRELNSKDTFCLKDTSHLIVNNIYNGFLCITNSFTNKSFIIRELDWNVGHLYPYSFFKYVKYPRLPLKQTLLPKRLIDEINTYVTFIIALSYDCNLRCKYCYQQCDPNLNRSKISASDLDQVLQIITEYEEKHPEKHICIGLFGGEPLLEKNRRDILTILDFCVEHCFPVSITTNGVNLPYYLKDLVIYSGLGITINTTIDSIPYNGMTRYNCENEEKSQSADILKSIKTLINNDVTVLVEINIDQHNIDELDSMILFYKENGLLDNPNFRFGISRVDDRRYEIGYDNMVSASELLQKLLSIDINSKHIYFAFVKAALALYQKIKPDFNQYERKYISNYCWAQSSLDDVFYVDAALNTFRCTYTVGRTDYSLAKFSLDFIENYRKPNRTYLDQAKCKNCNIGGYCAGGCILSAEVDFERMCREEKEDFQKFLINIYYPEVFNLMRQYNLI